MLFIVKTFSFLLNEVCQNVPVSQATLACCLLRQLIPGKTFYMLFTAVSQGKLVKGRFGSDHTFCSIPIFLCFPKSNVPLNKGLTRHTLRSNIINSDTTCWDEGRKTLLISCFFVKSLPAAVTGTDQSERALVWASLDRFHIHFHRCLPVCKQRKWCGLKGWLLCFSFLNFFGLFDEGSEIRYFSHELSPTLSSMLTILTRCPINQLMSFNTQLIWGSVTHRCTCFSLLLCRLQSAPSPSVNATQCCYFISHH